MPVVKYCQPECIIPGLYLFEAIYSVMVVNTFNSAMFLFFLALDVQVPCRIAFPHLFICFVNIKCVLVYYHEITSDL